MALLKHGFLGTEGEWIQQQILQKYASLFSLLRDFNDICQQRLLAFQAHHQRSASPFNWTFTRRDLNALLAEIPLKRLDPAV